MTKKNLTIFTLIFIIIIIIVAGLWFGTNLSNYFTYDHNQEKERPDLVEAKYDNKIVYNNQADLEKIKNDCAARGGDFNNCGSVCPPEADICAEVCGKVCILEEGDSKNEQKNSDKEDFLNSNLLDYDNEKLGFSLKYFKGTNIKEEAENRIEFLWLGSQQKPGTEITDGVRVLVSKLNLPAQISLKNHLQEKIDDARKTGKEILSDIELENHYDYATYTYTVLGLGEYKHLIVPVNSQKYFDISIFTSHDRYQKFVDEILKTFKITDSEKISTKKPGVIAVEEPLLGQNISSPLQIKGQAIGSWFYEANFKVTLTDWDGKIIAESVATTKHDWMTEKMVPFEAELEFEKPENLYMSKALLILEKSNPSGLPENNEALEYFVYFD